jgi:hypothetical protein
MTRPIALSTTLGDRYRPDDDGNATRCDDRDKDYWVLAEHIRRVPDSERPSHNVATSASSSILINNLPRLRAAEVVLDTLCSTPLPGTTDDGVRQFNTPTGNWLQPPPPRATWPRRRRQTFDLPGVPWVLHWWSVSIHGTIGTTTTTAAQAM